MAAILSRPHCAKGPHCNLSERCHMYYKHTRLVLHYIPRNMHTVFALLCFVVVIHWLIFPYPSGLLHWHCHNLTIASVPAKKPWWIWINTSCELFMNDCITTTKQSTTTPCVYFLGYTVIVARCLSCCLINVLTSVDRCTQSGRSNLTCDITYAHVCLTKFRKFPSAFVDDTI